MNIFFLDENVITVYRNYYILEKNNFTVWKHSEELDWYTEGIQHANL